MSIGNLPIKEIQLEERIETLERQLHQAVVKNSLREQYTDRLLNKQRKTTAVHLSWFYILFGCQASYHFLSWLTGWF